MQRRTLLLGGSALLLVGAGPRRAYLKQHRAFTRELVLYYDAATALMLRATLLEPAFRVAMADERRRLMGPTDADHAAFVARMEADAAAYFDVAFAADSAFDNATRFGPGDDRWNLRLEADGAEQPFVQVDRIAKPSRCTRRCTRRRTSGPSCGSPAGSAWPPRRAPSCSTSAAGSATANVPGTRSAVEPLRTTSLTGYEVRDILLH